MKRLFFFQKKKLRYIQIPLWLQALFTLLSILIIAAVILFGLFYLTLPFISTPQTQALEQQLQDLTQIEDSLKLRIKSIEANLQQISLIEKKIRALVLNDSSNQKDEISQSDTSTSLSHASQKLQELKKLIDSQETRLQEIQNFLENNPSLSLYLPFSAPLQQINWGCGFGEKQHPVTKQPHFHQGIDFLCPEGTPILATANGKVIFAGTKPAYGKVVIIQHIDNIQTLYAHLSSIRVKRGQNVARNTVIGYSGSSGIVLAPALHYEIQIQKKPVDPFHYLQVLLNEESKEKAKKHLTSCNVSLD